MSEEQHGRRRGGAGAGATSRRALLTGTAGLAAAAGAAGAGLFAARPAAAAATTPSLFLVTDSFNGVPGATGDGVTDDTTSVQSALDAAAAAGGGVVHFPTGNYLISKTLSWTSPAPLTITGDNMGANSSLAVTGSCLLLNAFPMHGLDISNAHSFALRDMSIFTNVNCTDPTVDFVAVNISNVVYAHVERFHTASGPGLAFRANVGLKVTASHSMITDCDIRAQQFAIWMFGGAEMEINHLSTTATPGTSGSNIVMDNGAGTMHITNVITDSGDRGVWMRETGGNVPAFVYINDLEVNSPAYAGVELSQGGGFWANQLWISDETPLFNPAVLNYGLLADSGFTGTLTMQNSVIQKFSGHGMWIQGGVGYYITTTSFGECGSYKGIGNSYDDLHIEEGSIRGVTIADCHFDIDVANTLITSAPARCAIWVGQGTTLYTIHNNIFASGYGTRALIDNNFTPAVATGPAYNNNINA